MDVLAEPLTCRFGNFLLDREGRALYRLSTDGERTVVPIGSRALGILYLLIDRRGEFVSRREIFETVWPNAVVEESNLTVQMAALRRVLDAGRKGESCIQTVPGRGYRFVLQVTGAERVEPLATSEANLVASPPLRPRWRWWFAGLGGIAMALLLAVWHSIWFAGTPPPPLSIVVLPFENLSGTPRDDYLADAITDELTGDLSNIGNSYVVAPQSAYSYKGMRADVRKFGEQLGVRYVLTGSVQKIDSELRINARLIASDTGTQLWSDRFDEQIGDLAAAQEQIVMRLRDELDLSMVDIENARSLRERPTNPEAFDLVLRGRALQHLPMSLQGEQEALALYERALALDPRSIPAMVGVAYFLVDTSPIGDWGNFENMRRAGRLLERAREQAPGSERILNTYVYWLRSVGRCPEAIETAERAILTDANRVRIQTGIYNELAVCKAFTGYAEEAIALQKKADELNPRSPYKFSRYQHMGFNALLLGRDRDAIRYFQQSFALNPDVHGGTEWDYRWLAAAYARIGQMQEARHYLAEADRLWPYDTVRGHFPPYPSSAVFVEQLKRIQAALALVGERDHADEDADFGVPADRALRGEFAGRTPREAPGAKTIRSGDLVRFLAEARPVVIDNMTYFWGPSIPGAVGLKFAGLGGSFTDAAQDQLRDKMRELTEGHLDRPIVAVGWNSERFDGRNLALRLVALGYTRVYWYRGGREAWEVNGLPETNLDVQQW